MIHMLTLRKGITTVSIGTTVVTRALNSITLKCPVQYYGQVNIIWFKNGKIIKDEEQHKDIFKLWKVGIKDSGEYVCRSNDLAKVEFGTVKVNVLRMFSNDKIFQNYFLIALHLCVLCVCIIACVCAGYIPHTGRSFFLVLMPLTMTAKVIWKNRILKDLSKTVHEYLV